MIAAAGDDDCPPVRVLLTDAEELAGLSAVRSLGRAGHRVTAAYPLRAHGGPPPSARSVHCAAALPCPDPWREQPAFRAWLRGAAESGDYDAILPLSEAAIHAAAALRRDGLGAPGGAPEAAPKAAPQTAPVWVLPPDESLRFALSKYEATQAAARLGVPTPRTVFLADGVGVAPAPAETAAELGALGYPLVIKHDNHVAPGGAYRKGRCWIVTAPAEAEAALAQCRAAGAATLAQELVPGHGAGAFLLRHDGRVRLRFAHRRLHEVPWSGGWSSLRESVHDSEMMGLAEALLAGLGYDGVAMVEFRRDARDGGLRFLEINGRLWGSLALALHAGADFPRLLLAAALGCPEDGRPRGEPLRAAPGGPLGGPEDGLPRGGGAPPEAPDYRDGVRCRNVFPGELEYLRSVLRARRVPGLPAPPDKAAALLDFLRLSLDPSVRHDHFWWSDPAPGLWQALEVSAEVLLRGARRGLRGLESLRARAALRPLRAASRRVRAGGAPRAGGAGLLTARGEIVFLCHGNICRSPFCAAYWNRRLGELGLPGPRARSAGFYPVPGRATPPRDQALARALGVDLSAHRSVVADAESLRGAQAIFLMDRQNARELARRLPALRGRAHLLGDFGELAGSAPGSAEIPDPYGREPAEARACYERLARSLEGLLRQVERGGAR